MDLEKFNEIIKEIIDVSKKEDRYTRELILSKIEELNLEVHKKSPNKNVIYNILDWLSKITSVAGFCITLNSILNPIVGA